MIKIVQAVYQTRLEIKLRFSDGSFGVMDFSEMLSHKTSLTLALEDGVFFSASLSSWVLFVGLMAWSSVRAAFIKGWKNPVNWLSQLHRYYPLNKLPMGQISF